MNNRPRKDYGSPLRIWDDGGKSYDRYTITAPRSARASDTFREWDGSWRCLAASENPQHPQGFGQHSSCTPGPHLGKRITWQELPAAVQKFVRASEFGQYCPNESPTDTRKES
jgi:hypothetical protein